MRARATSDKSTSRELLMRKLARGLVYILAAIGALGVIGMLLADPESPPAAEAGPEPEPVATQQPATPEPEEEPEPAQMGMPTCEAFRETFAEPVPSVHRCGPDTVRPTCGLRSPVPLGANGPIPEGGVQPQHASVGQLPPLPGYPYGCRGPSMICNPVARLPAWAYSAGSGSSDARRRARRSPRRRPT